MQIHRLSRLHRFKSVNGFSKSTGSQKSVWLADDLKERGIDELNPIWNVLDLTPQGRGSWYASLEYGLKVQGVQAARRLRK